LYLFSRSLPSSPTVNLSAVPVGVITGIPTVIASLIKPSVAPLVTAPIIISAFFDTNVLNIYGNTICRSGSIDNNYNKGDTTYILLSDIADVTKDKFIILNYLEYTYFKDVLYDGEFVWVITGNKNENNQLLKLKLL
jgi:hypothetical protein